MRESGSRVVQASPDVELLRALTVLAAKRVTQRPLADPGDSGDVSDSHAFRGMLAKKFRRALDDVFVTEAGSEWHGAFEASCVPRGRS